MKKIFIKKLVMLMFLRMTERKVCSSCGVEKEVSEFPNERNVCRPCKQMGKEHLASGSYKVYLTQLFINSRSKASGGQRDHIRDFSITKEDVIDLWEKQNGRCAVSGVFLTHHKDGTGTKEFNASLDRITNTKGYTKNNVHLVCYRVNIMKHVLSEDMFYWWIKTIHDFSCD